MSPIRMVTAPPSTRDYVSVKLTDQGYLLYLSKYLAPCLHTAVKPMWRDMLKDSLGVKDSHVSFQCWLKDRVARVKMRIVV